MVAILPYHYAKKSYNNKNTILGYQTRFIYHQCIHIKGREILLGYITCLCVDMGPLLGKTAMANSFYLHCEAKFCIYAWHLKTSNFYSI